MNLNLNVLARLMVLNNLPEQGSIEKIMNKRNVRNKISFSSEELDKLNLTTTDAGITWNHIDDITVDFTDTEIKFLNEVIMDLDSKGLISEGFIDFVMDVRSNIETENN